MKRKIIVIVLLTALFLPAVTTAQVSYENLTVEQRIVIIQEIKVKIQELMTLLISMIQEQLSPIQTDVSNPVDTSSQGTLTQPIEINMTKETQEIKETKKSVTLELFSPYPKTGFGRKLKVSPILPDMENESNYIDIGLIVRDENGVPVKDKIVTITSKDESPIERDGTGTIGKVAINGSYVFVPYYHYHYEFKTSGKQKITFATEGETISVELDIE